MNVLPGKRKKPLPGRAAGWADNLLFGLFTVMIFSVTANMVSRLVFHRPIIQSDEVSRYSFIWLCFIGSASALHGGEHIGVDLVVKRLPEKMGRSILALTNLAMAGLTALFACYGFAMALRALGQMSSVTPIPYGYVILIMPASFIAMSLIFLRNLTLLLRGPE